MRSRSDRDIGGQVKLHRAGPSVLARPLYFVPLQIKFRYEIAGCGASVPGSSMGCWAARLQTEESANNLNYNGSRNG
jgi:hypothetical protein